MTQITHSAETKFDASQHWDMTPIFPSLSSTEFENAFQEASASVDEIIRYFEINQIRRRTDSKVDERFARLWEETTEHWNCLQERMRTLSAYIHSFVSTDASNEEAKSKQSLLNMLSVKISALSTRYTAWMGTSDIDALIDKSELAKSHEYLLRKAKEQATHQMSETEETLASELSTSALTGWVKLHGNMSALLAPKVALPEGEKSLPMSEVRALAMHSDRNVRRAAYEAELLEWESVATPFAAALNGVKGYQGILHRKRGYANDLEPTLSANGIDLKTLEAMQAACEKSFPDFRRYMRLKARALKLEKLEWYDLTAPVGSDEKVYSWEDAKDFVIENFGKFSPKLADFARRSFEEGWHDSEPRVGKQGGAYCTGILPGVSRLFMNFSGSFNSVSTLAHELGHAYHNFLLKDRTSLQRGTPMTLAETASIFCETLGFEAALKNVTGQERLSLLDTVLERNLMVVVDIHSRFLFEKAVFERRAVRDLTVAEFNSLMTEAQEQTFGEGVCSLHPLMWAVKGHYYGPVFYNYPYTFGLLFGLGLYQVYLSDPGKFKERYDDLLASTGMANAITLTGRFGFDCTQESFWNSSLNLIRKQIDEYEILVEGMI